MRSMPDNLDFAQSLDKVARTDGTATGTAVDTGRDHFQRMGILDVGTWTDGTHTFTFEESDDNSSWSAMAAAQLDDPGEKLTGNAVVISSDAEDDSIIEIGFLTVKRYVRAKQVTASSSTGMVAGVNIASGAKRYAGGVGQPMSATGYKRIAPSI